MKKITHVLSAISLVLLFGGCARNISSNEYSESEVGDVKQTYRGVILNARNVRVQGADRLQDNSMGVVGGGVGGALIGSQFGKGRGAVVGTALGAGLGALGGAFAEKKLKEQDGVEYTVELSSGRIMTIVQGPEPRLQPGQPVLVMVGSKGRSRVVADQTGGMSFAQRGAAPAAYPQQQAVPMQQQNYPRPQGQAYAPAPNAYPQNGPAFNAVDHNHRDSYARDIAERSAGPRVIVQ